MIMGEAKVNALQKVLQIGDILFFFCDIGFPFLLRMTCNNCKIKGSVEMERNILSIVHGRRLQLLNLFQTITVFKPPFQLFPLLRKPELRIPNKPLIQFFLYSPHANSSSQTPIFNAMSACYYNCGSPLLLAKSSWESCS
jgi:hypothetical protein